jgi:hypothetical protein
VIATIDKETSAVVVCVNDCSQREQWGEYFSDSFFN